MILLPLAHHEPVERLHAGARAAEVETIRAN